MAEKREYSKTVVTYEFSLTHEDIVKMMNDTQVQLFEGNVSGDQTFQLSLTSTSGSKIRLSDLKENDKLTFSFNVSSNDGTTEALGNIDVT